MSATLLDLFYGGSAACFSNSSGQVTIIVSFRFLEEKLKLYKSLLKTFALQTFIPFPEAHGRKSLSPLPTLRDRLAFGQQGIEGECLHLGLEQTQQTPYQRTPENGEAL